MLTHHRLRRLLPAAVLVSLAVPATASARLDLDLGTLPYSISPSAVKLVKAYPGDGRPANVHYEWIQTFNGDDPNYRQPCSVVDWAAAQKTPDQLITATGNVDVTAVISGLTPGQRYCFRMAATLADGSDSGQSGTSFASAGTPTANERPLRTSGPSQVSAKIDLSTAAQDTSLKLGLGPSPCRLGQPIPPDDADGSLNVPADDGEFHTATARFTGAFTRGQELSTCIEAHNASGAGNASVWGERFRFGQAFVDGENPEATGLTTSAATIATTASGAGAPGQTQFRVRAEKADGTCFDGKVVATLPGQALPADYADHEISAKVTGLDSNTRYCFEASATNDVGTKSTSDAYDLVHFKTLPLPAESVSGSSNAGTVTPLANGVVTLPKVVAGCGKGPCSYTSTATVPAKVAAAAAKKKAPVKIATGRLKLKTGQESPIGLKLTPAGKKLLAKKKTLTVTVVVAGKDGAGKKVTKTVRAKFTAAKKA